MNTDILQELRDRGFTSEDRSDYSSMRPGGLYSKWTHPDGRVWLHGMHEVGDEIGIIQPKVFRKVERQTGRETVWEYLCRDLNNYGRAKGAAALFDFINDNANKYAEMP